MDRGTFADERTAGGLVAEMRRRMQRRQQVRETSISDIREVGVRGFRREAVLSLETDAARKSLEQLNHWAKKKSR